MKFEMEVLEPQTQRGQGGTSGDAFRVVLYDDDWHAVDDVIRQVQKATTCSREKARTVVREVEAKGRAICFHGERDECHRVAGVLREIRLQCEVDCD